MIATRVEDDLIERLKRHEHLAIADLYDRHGPLVYSIVKRIVWNPGDAEDLVQEVFLRVWKRAHLLDASRGGLSAWLVTVARNVAIDSLRGARTPHSLLGDRADVRLFDQEITHLNRLRIERAMESLDSNQRIVIELAYFEGLSQGEMAQRLNQPLGTIKTWIRAALFTLRGSKEEGSSTPGPRPASRRTRSEPELCPGSYPSPTS